MLLAIRRFKVIDPSTLVSISIRPDGSTADRQALIDQFNDHHTSVTLCSLLAAGHGINLTAANHVYQDFETA